MQGAERRAASIGRLIGERLSGRPDSEHEQALVRVAIVVCLSAFFWLHGRLGAMAADVSADGLLIVAAYLGLSSLYVLWIVLRPRKHPIRRLCAMVTDFTTVSLLLAVGGAEAAPLYPLYLWIALGNGFRYGRAYLAASVVVAFAGFLAVVLFNPFWHGILPLSVGLLVALVVIPAYAAALIRKLTEAKAQAEAANEAKSRFLAIVSHELRTPLNAVIGMGDLLVGSGLTADQRDMVHTIRVSGKALLSLIDTVLDFSRIEAGKVTVPEGDFDLDQQLADTAAMLRPQAQSKGIDLVVSLDSATPPGLRGDWPHIRQILTNLVANAIKFTDRGEVALRVGPAAGDEGQGRVVFEVADTGIGIAEADLDRIFESFTQADQAVNRRYGGAGLGLAISRQLAGLLGGTISVTSRLGKGSVFRVELPLQPTAAADANASLPLEVTAFCDDGAVLAALSGLGVQLQSAGVEEAQTEAGARALLIDVRGGAPPADARAAAARWEGPVMLLTDPGQPAEHCRGTMVILDGVAPAALARGVRACRAFAAAGRAETGVSSLAVRPAGRALHVLVAEDNPVNRKVIAKILDTAGHRCDVVCDADEALARLAAEDYDAVILDVNMPGTSSLDAVRFYRMAHLGEQRLPILALSADATPATALACREAGMDAYLTKPVEARQLLQVVQALAAAVGDRHDATPPAKATPFRPVAVADSVAWDALQQLEALGGKAFAAEVTDEFVTDIDRLLEQMEEALARRNAEDFRLVCHALRSSSANVGAKAIHRLCQDAGGMDLRSMAREGAGILAALRHEALVYADTVRTHFAGRKAVGE